MTSRKIINSKLKEAVDSVLPITIIVAVLCFFFLPVGSGLMLAFLVGAVLLIVGMGLFTLGAELYMTKMGNLVGAKMTKSRRLWLILVLAFILGLVITIAEPDLQVLAQNVPGIDKTVAAVRSAHGCVTPFDILPSVWLSSALSVTAGLLAARGLQAVWRR